PPIVSVIGNSESGKTNLIEKLIQELKSRGYRVATIKHIPQGVNFDEPGKDSWRHIQAGSEATAISSPDRIVLIKPSAQDSALDEVTHLLGEDYDIILTEGFKHGNAPKIEVHRKDAGSLLKDIKKLIGIVTDEPLDTKVRQFSFDDVNSLVDLLEKGFIKPQAERISLYVNNTSVILTAFPKQIIMNVLLAVVSCLKGVGEIKNLQIFFKKE
ncbi:MAG: molybdopterin-guanine dinucleotide biosynthesis protein B, partial [Deltaproteobacteria bacterium]|nr:molybdopterin-guanine dinucleotide biosynthesis protein B [Deltaproteobacteria bacterium]